MLLQCRCRDMELVCVLLLCLCPACVCQVPRACSESDGVLQAPVCSVSTELPSPSPHSSADRTKSVSDGPMVSLGKGLNGLVYLGGRGRVLKSIKLMVGVWEPSGQLSDLTPHCQALEAVGSGGRWCWSSARFTPRGRTATARPTCGWVWWPGRGWEVDIQM